MHGVEFVDLPQIAGGGTCRGLWLGTFDGSVGVCFGTYETDKTLTKGVTLVG